MRLISTVKAVQKSTVLFSLVDQPCLFLIEFIDTEVPIFVGLGQEEPVEIAGVAVIHFSLIDGFVSVLNEVVNSNQISQVSILSEGVGAVYFGLNWIHPMCPTSTPHLHFLNPQHEGY